MKTIYLDCSTGVSAESLASALYELIDNKEKFIAHINSVGIKGVRVAARTESKCGLEGTRLSVRIMEKSEGSQYNNTHDTDNKYSHMHRRRTLQDVEELVSRLNVSPKVRDDVMAIYKLIANAESKTHSKSLSEIHFHQEGSRDTITNIVMVAMLLEQLSTQKIIASPVNIGGTDDEHSRGILPVSTPSITSILRGIPVYSEKTNGGICTLAGAALLKYYVADFGDMPVIQTEKIGYGMGTKNQDDTNYMRAVLGEVPDASTEISELCCNVDDMTAEQIAYATQSFFAAGALEVYTIPIITIKSRPANLICVICNSEDKEMFIALIFKHTTATNIKEKLNRRYILNCREETESTSLGPVKKQIAEGYGVMKTKYEFDSLEEIAKKYNISIAEVLKQISK